MARRRKGSDPFEFVGAAVLLFGCAYLYPPTHELAVRMEIYGAVIAAVVALVLIGVTVKKKRRAPIDAAAVSADQPARAATTPNTLEARLHKIDWFQFEKVVELAFCKTHQVDRRGGANPDGGIDLMLEKDGQRTAVQCKHWKSWKVGVKVVRELLGAMTDVGVTKGIIVSIGSYSEEAIALAQRHGIDLVDTTGLKRLLAAVEQAELDRVFNDERKICPKCEREMVLRTASRGNRVGQQFWGCSGFPECRFKFSAEVEER